MANIAKHASRTPLLTWQKIMSFVTDIYRITGLFPVGEADELSCMIRQCAAATSRTMAVTYCKTYGEAFADSMKNAENNIFNIRKHLEISLSRNYLSRCEFDRIDGNLKEICLMIRDLGENNQYAAAVSAVS